MIENITVRLIHTDKGIKYAIIAKGKLIKYCKSVGAAEKFVKNLSTNAMLQFAVGAI